jgi:hypothetical protein
MFGRLDEGVILCEPKRISGGKHRRIGLLVLPFVDGTFERRTQ